MKTPLKPAKAPKMTMDECRAALDAARETLATCEQAATVVSDWNTLKALKVARVAVAELQTQWDKMQPAPELELQKAEPKPAPPIALIIPAEEHSASELYDLWFKSVFGFLPVDETIDGQNVQQVAREQIDLSVAFSPVIYLPDQHPCTVESMRGGTLYRLIINANFWCGNIKPDNLKIMRARYLLTRDAKYKELQNGKPFDNEARAFFPDGVIVCNPTSTPTVVTMACLKLVLLLRAMGQDDAIKTDGKLDEPKLKRVCNEIVRGVASDRPTPTTETWTVAARLHSERNGYVWHKDTKKWEQETT